METSFNCSVLSNETLKSLNEFSVNIFKKDNEIFTDLGNNRYDIEKFKVDHLKDYICKVTNSDKHATRLWKVNVVDEVGIKEKLKDENEMKPRLLFSDYFQDELSGEAEFTVTNIHIISTTSTGPFQQGVPQGPVVGSLEEALSVILQNIPVKIETSSEGIEILEEMPLKERDTKEALTVFENNVTKSFNRFASKSSFNFLVCGGAAGIGKTRWGREFFNSVERQHWNLPLSWSKPKYLYLLLDFVNGVRLGSLDKDLEASTILGLRVAFDYFVRRKREMSFEAFKILAKPLINFFGIELVFSHIHQGIEPNQKFIIVLHIDEFQEIFAFEDHWEGGLASKGLFKEMLCALGPLMIDCGTRYYVQTFLSGTASQYVTNNFKATEYSFEFVKCPLLSNKSIIEIFNYYAEKRGGKEKLWMYNTKFIQLLYDTGGLPRALETVLDECFKRDRFVPKLNDKNFTLFDDIFHAVINVLTNKYKLDKFIRNHRKASCQLLHHCIGAIPVQLNTKLGSEQTVTVEDLERDGFLILKSIGPNNYLIEMPFYFIYIYNMWLNMASATIHKMFQPESKMAWDTWEKFVANYEIFRNNLLFELEQHKEGIVSLKEFYRGAIGKASVLNIRVRLEKLELCEAKNQFPKTGFPRNCDNNKVMDLDGLVIINDRSAPFGDVVLLRKKIPEDRNLLIAHQQKWYTTSRTLTIDDAVEECKKNQNAYKDVLEKPYLRPYMRIDHIKVLLVIEKNSTYRSYLENAKTQLENCSYAPHSFLDNEHDSMILDEYDSYSGDNDIEMGDLQD
ncbi:hypothetical protein GLOIN_2v1878909 [Rhizophagus clarus]|uniref:Crinkler family protein n=1 Tax=Rhizophagus clarus TaxID=94130 RepID=A0A8H3MI03_9GLOM|nr:hypothetical protein GLOIN_2v1878909 [Rhizophagus clarus]